VLPSGPRPPVSYVSRDGRTIMLVRPGPSIEPHLIGVESLLPSQVAMRTARTGVQALLTRLLVEALADAQLVVGGRWRRRGDPRRCALARAWLTGALDGEVSVPLGWVCDVLALDPGRLADACARACTARSAGGPGAAPEPADVAAVEAAGPPRRGPRERGDALLDFASEYPRECLID
jgi:hypothetical protein